MKRRTAILTAILALVALVAVPFLYAQPHGRHRMAGPGGGPGFGPLGLLGHAREELNLSDQQVDEIKAIFQATREANAANREQLKGGLEGVMTTLLQDPNNVAAAQALLDKQAAAERAMKTNMLNATAKALSVLTAEQRSKLATMIADRKAHFQEFKQRRPRR